MLKRKTSSLLLSPHAAPLLEGKILLGLCSLMETLLKHTTKEKDKNLTRQTLRRMKKHHRISFTEALVLAVRRGPRVHKRASHLLKRSHKIPVSSAHPSRPAPDSAAPLICSSCLCLIAILSIIYLRLHILSLCSFPLPTQRGVHTRHEG